jgi:hypothetical protein
LKFKKNGRSQVQKPRGVIQHHCFISFLPLILSISLSILLPKQHAATQWRD